MLGNTTGLVSTDVGLTNRVQQARLTVVDVTHHSYHWRALLQVLIVALVLTELEVEGLEELAVLILRRDDLDLVIHLVAEQLQGLVGDRCSCRHHFAEVEQRLDQRCCIGVNLLSEVRQGCTTCEANGRALTVGQLNAAYHGWCLHCLVLVALLTLRLTSATRGASWSPECTCSSTATSAATTARSATRATRAATTAAEATATATAACLCRHLPRVRVRRHHCRSWTIAARLITAALSTLRARAALACSRLRARTAVSTLRARATLASTRLRARTARTALRTRHVGRPRCRTGGSAGREWVVRHTRCACAWLRPWLRASRLRRAWHFLSRLRRTGRCSWLGTRFCRRWCSRLGTWFCSWLGTRFCRRWCSRLSAWLSCWLGTRLCCSWCSRLSAWLSCWLGTRLCCSWCSRLSAWLSCWLGTRLSSRLSCSLGRWGLGRRVSTCASILLFVDLLHLPDDGWFHRRRSGLNKLALSLQLGE